MGFIEELRGKKQREEERKAQYTITREAAAEAERKRREAAAEAQRSGFSHYEDSAISRLLPEIEKVDKQVTRFPELNSNEPSGFNVLVSITGEIKSINRGKSNADHEMTEGFKINTRPDGTINITAGRGGSTTLTKEQSKDPHIVEEALGRAYQHPDKIRFSLYKPILPEPR